MLITLTKNLDFFEKIFRKLFPIFVFNISPSFFLSISIQTSFGHKGEIERVN